LKTKKKLGVKYWDKKLIGNGGVVNEYIKRRDATSFTPEGKPIAPCITCKREVSGSSLHCGHWISRKHKGVAYDEHNLAAQCAGCNKWGNGEPQMFEDELRLLYGDKEVNRIRSWVGKPRKWTPAELEDLYHKYKEKLAEYK
jgi:hypothetical protein